MMVEYSLKNGKVILFFLIVMVIGAFAAFGSLGKKEDAPFVIKQAVIFASYPGAMAEEVEDKVTKVIENRLQTMPNVYRIESDSYFGMSKVRFELQPYTPASEIEQMWDILRRKILSLEQELPQGVRVSVNDEFGDVFGIYFALTASEGFTYQDLRHWSKKIESTISTAKGVEMVKLFALRDMVVKISISTSRLASLGLSPDKISQIIASQNRLIRCGERRAGEMELLFYSEGLYESVEDIKNQVVITTQSGEVRIGDIASVSLDYSATPSTLMSVNNQKAVGIAVSSPSDEDVVKTGKNVREKLAQIEQSLPIGLDIVPLYSEDEIAQRANIGFIVNLIESVAIVIFILLLAMGARSSLIIGSSLLFSISGTLLIMQFLGVGLNRTSLAGFIIAMGMLVDNAIVVVDNCQNNMKQQMGKREAIIAAARQPMWGLLGATLIAIFSFLPLYLAKASVAEIVQPLFVVIGVSLLLSWLLAMTQTPSFASIFLKEDKNSARKVKKSESNRFYRAFSKILSLLIEFKYVTTASMVALLFFSFWVMGQLPQNFFPALDKEYFRAEIFLPNGYSIFETQNQAQRLEKWLLNEPAVKRVSIAVGSSPPRYYLASAAFGPMATFGSLLVELNDKDSTIAVEERFNDYAQSNFPNLVVKSSLFKVSPVPEATIEIGFLGENIDTLALLTQKVKDIMAQEPLVDRVRDSWGAKIPMVVPHYSPTKGARVGVSRAEMAQSFQMVSEGVAVGSFGYEEQYLPILLTNLESEDFNLNDLANIPVFASEGRSFPLSSVTSSIETCYVPNVLRRYNHSSIMLAQCEPKRGGSPSEAFNKIWERVQREVQLPEGYSLKFRGERESQEESNEALAANLPLTAILIFIILLLLFRGYKKPLIILLVIPLIFIGVVLGLVVTGKMFDFFSILGLLGLVGMSVKNGVVLVEQIQIESNKFSSLKESIIEATASRLLPVVLASGTTILGMVPLLGDAMFAGMAATIMGGLFVATLLTLFILPVVYSLFYRNIQKLK